jgi:RNA polymerase sigma-70 factor (ECF subfamily)
MFVLDNPYGSLLRFVFWMEARRPSRLAAPRPGNGGSSGNGPGGPPDPEAEFRLLFDTYFEPVCSYFRRRGIRDDQARDLAQETFLRVYRSLSWFRREASPRTWIYLIAKNVWCNELRRRLAEKREGREVSLQKLTEEGPSLADDLRFEGWAGSRGALESILADERRAKLFEALRKLPERMRRCVLLRIHGDLKYREIAVLMNTSIQTVKSQLSQAQDRLSRELGSYFDPSDVRGDGD